MSDETAESSEKVKDSEEEPLDNVSKLEIFKKLEELCGEKTLDLGLLSERNHSGTRTEFKFRNCYEALIASEFESYFASQPEERDFASLFSGFVKKGFGIAEIRGPSGSGKTSLCVKIAKKAEVAVLYLDLNGSLDPKRAYRTASFIPIRLYTLEELTLLLTDLEHRLEGDKALCEVLDLKARSLEMLIVDSLWCVDELTKFQRQEFLYRISLVLRRISWRYGINVLVCINQTQSTERTPRQADEANSAEGRENPDSENPERRPRDIYKKWSCNCYTQVLLSNKTLNFILNRAKRDRSRPPLAYRTMHIVSGTLNKKFKFIINDNDIVLEDR